MKEKSKESTIIVSTHILSGIETLMKKGIILDAGRGIYEGDIYDVLRRARELEIIGR